MSDEMNDVTQEPPATPAKRTRRKAAAKTAEPKTEAVGLEARLIRAQAALVPPAKDARNDHHRYDYTSAEEMLRATRAALSEAGLAASADEWDLVSTEGGIVLARIVCRMVSLEGESREMRVTWPVIAERGRPLDKALAGALTAALSYWLRGLLLVPREDPSVAMDARDDRRSVPPRPAAAEPRRPSPTAEQVQAVVDRKRAEAGVPATESAAPVRSMIEVVSVEPMPSAEDPRCVKIAAKWDGQSGDLFINEHLDLAMKLGTFPGAMFEGVVLSRTGRGGKKFLTVTDWIESVDDGVAA